MATVTEFFLAKLRQQHNITLDAEWVDRIEVMATSVDGGTRRARVVIKNPWSASIQNFQVDYPPINLAQLIPGGAVHYLVAGPDGEPIITQAQIRYDLLRDQGITLYDDHLTVTTTRDSNGTGVIVQAGSESVLYYGQLRMSQVTDVYEVLKITQGGTRAVTTAQDYNEAQSERALSYLMAEQESSDSRLGKALVWTLREMVDQGGLDLSGTCNLGGDAPAVYTTDLLHEVSDFTDLHAFGMIIAVGNEPVQLEVFNLDGEQELLVHSEVLRPQRWVNFPVTANLQRLRFTHLGDTAKQVGLNRTMRLMRMRYVGQPVAEYRPHQEVTIDQYDVLAFSGMERLEGEQYELINGKQSLFAVVDGRTLPTSGTANLIALVPESGDGFSLHYNGDTAQAELRYGSRIVSVDVPAFEGFIPLLGTVDTSGGRLELFTPGGTQWTEMTPMTPLSAGKLRIGGSGSAPFKLRTFGHLARWITHGMGQWFIKNTH